MSSSVFSESFNGIRMFSRNRPSFLLSEMDSLREMLRAPRCAAKEAMVQVTRIITMVPLSTLSFSSRMGSPAAVSPMMTL